MCGAIPSIPRCRPSALRGLRQVWQPGEPHRRAPELERAAASIEPNRKGVAMSRAILGDAIFAVVFSIVMVTIARFLWALM